MEFTDRAKKVLMLAKVQAMNNGCTIFCTDHILIAILKEATCEAFCHLKSMGLDLGGLMRQLMRSHNGDANLKSLDEFNGSDSAEEVISIAKKIAGECSCKYADTNHLLYGLVNVEEGVAYTILDTFGITSDGNNGVRRKTPTEECRVRLLCLDACFMISVLNWWRDPPGYLQLPEIDLPDDCVVAGIFYSFEMRCFMARVASAEFLVCPVGTIPETIPGVYKVRTVDTPFGTTKDTRYEFTEWYDKVESFERKNLTLEEVREAIKGAESKGYRYEAIVVTRREFKSGKLVS